MSPYPSPRLEVSCPCATPATPPLYSSTTVPPSDPASAPHRRSARPPAGGTPGLSFLPAEYLAEQQHGLPGTPVGGGVVGQAGDRLVVDTPHRKAVLGPTEVDGLAMLRCSPVLG